MSKVKLPRSSAAIDMTPMVDMAFLLVTFFILTTQFRPDEPVQVSVPSSTSSVNPSEHGNITITIAPDGRIFFDQDNQNMRKALIEKMGTSYNIKFTVDEVNAFATGSSIGVPMREIKGYLAMDVEDRKKYEQKGIPVDSTDNTTNELSVWLKNARYTAPTAHLLIKGDSKSNYLAVRNVFNTMQKQKALKFGLITGDEAPPTIAKK